MMDSTVQKGEQPRRLKFIGCEIIYREACRLAALSPHLVDVQFLRKGLHDLEKKDMLARLQEAVDAASADPAYRAVLLGYARCNDGVAGLRARRIPLVIPKAHDCITFFFGHRDRYKEYFDAHPGSYFHTTGWLERNDSTVPDQRGVMAKLGRNGVEEIIEVDLDAEERAALDKSVELIRGTMGALVQVKPA